MKTQINALYINSKEMYEFDVFGNWDQTSDHSIKEYVEDEIPTKTSQVHYLSRPCAWISLSLFILQNYYQTVAEDLHWFILYFV